MSRAEAFRQSLKKGTRWVSSSGMEVLVRDLDITDYAVLSKFPDHLRNQIYRVIERSASLRPDASDADMNPFEGLGGEELTRTMAETGTLLCKLGWIDPQVVDEVTDPDTQISVEDLAEKPDVRREYMTHVFGGQAVEAQRLTTFPERPADGVGTGSDVSAVRPDAEPTAAFGNAGILRSDGV
jgi:hypothetical protein